MTKRQNWLLLFIIMYLATGLFVGCTTSLEQVRSTAQKFGVEDSTVYSRDYVLEKTTHHAFVNLTNTHKHPGGLWWRYVYFTEADFDYGQLVITDFYIENYANQNSFGSYEESNNIPLYLLIPRTYYFREYSYIVPNNVSELP